MNTLDKKYTDLLQDILDNGVRKEDRTYMQWVDEVLEECDWKTSFEPKEIVCAIVEILENNPELYE